MALSRLARRALYRVYARASPWYRAGRLSHYRRLMTDADRWSADELSDFQLRLLRDLLSAAARTRFYPSRLAEARVDAGPLAGLEDLSRMPMLEKADITADTTALHVPGAPPFRSGATSGTTGAPMRVRTTAEMDAAARAARWRMLSWYDVRFGAPTLNFKGGNQQRDLALALTWFVAREAFGQTLRDAYRHRAEDDLRFLSRTRPEVVLGYPNVLVQLGLQAKRLGVDLSRLGVRVVVLGGEAVGADQRALLARSFGARVVGLYGSHESHYTGMECPAGALHIQETVLVEVVDEHGKRVDAGVEGDIVVTPLLGLAQPLIRYRLGDRGRVVTPRCPCGRATPALELDVCRIADMMELSDGRRVSSQLFQPMIHNAFGLHFGVDPKSYRVVQTDGRSFEFQLVMPEGQPLPARAGAFVEGLVQRALGQHVSARVVAVATLSPDTSGKRRCFIPLAEAERYRARPVASAGFPKGIDAGIDSTG
jgi:phenylacetate-CoA ligase